MRRITGGPGKDASGSPLSLVRRLREILTASAFLLPAAAAATPEDYVSFDAISKRHALRLSREPSMGVVIGEGEGLRVTAGPGLSAILINGKGIPLERPVIEQDGEIWIPAEAARAIPTRALAADLRPPPEGARRTGTPGSAEPVAIRPADAATAISVRSAGPVRPPSRPFTVVLDAGHGGPHTGGKGRGGLLEKTVNLDVALRLQRRLAAAGIRVILTRASDAAFSDDRNEDLRRRFDICNRAYPDLFLSIHSNWSESSSARGFEVYVRRERATDRREKVSDAAAYPIPAERLGGIPLRDAAVERMLTDLLVDRSAAGSRLLAREIEERFRRSLPTENRGLKEQDFQVIRWSNCPAVLVELEFISNARGERELSSPAHRDKLADLLAEAVRAFRARWAP